MKLLSDEELRTFYIENCAYEMAGCKYSELTDIAKQGIDKLVDDILLPVFNTQKRLYAESVKEDLINELSGYGVRGGKEIHAQTIGDEVVKRKVAYQLRAEQRAKLNG